MKNTILKMFHEKPAHMSVEDNRSWLQFWERAPKKPGDVWNVPQADLPLHLLVRNSMIDDPLPNTTAVGATTGCKYDPPEKPPVPSMVDSKQGKRAKKAATDSLLSGEHYFVETLSPSLRFVILLTK